MKKLNTDESKSEADSDVSAEYDTHSSNDEYVPEPVKTKPKPDRQIKIMTKSLPSFAKACDRTGVSDRSAAILATSVHHDLGLVSPIGPIESNRSKQDPPRTLENSRGTPAEWIKLDTSFWSRQQISQKNPCCRTHKHHRRARFFILQLH